MDGGPGLPPRPGFFAQAESLGLNWVQGFGTEVDDELVERLRHVSAAAVQAVAARYFGDDGLTVGVLLPQPLPPQAGAGTPSGDRHEKQCYSFDSAMRPFYGGYHPIWLRAGGLGQVLPSSTGRSPPAPRCTWWKATASPWWTCVSTSTRVAATTPALAGLASVMAASLSDGVRASGKEPALDEHQGRSLGGPGRRFQRRGQCRPAELSPAFADRARPARRCRCPGCAPAGRTRVSAALWQRDRPKWIASLREARTRPGVLAQRAYDAAVYGNHPYGREMTEAGLRRLQVRDLAALHAQVVRPAMPA